MVRNRNKVAASIPLFDTTLFIDGIPTYYSVAMEENKFRYLPSYENIIYPLPAFTVWQNDDSWYVESTDPDLTERETIEQAVEKIKRYYFYD